MDETFDQWEVIAPGLLTTVQDRGREGHRHLGVARAGALDASAATLGNLLLDNPVDAALLEISLRGPRLRLPAPARIALTGASLAARFDGMPVPMHRPVELPAGELDLGAVQSGVRSYLAVAGGLHTPPVMGSRSTDLRGGFGGIDGRALRAGDRLPLRALQTACDAPRWPRWWIGSGRDATTPHAPIRCVPSRHPAAAMLLRQRWQANPRSDRQGLRLVGDALQVEAASGVSEPVAPGTIQLPPDGQPIVLLADAQTVGGYPRLGHVIAADLPRLAQLGPHAALQFVAVTPAQAHTALCAERARLHRIGIALQITRQTRTG